jgi:hypothetical protein
MSAQGVGFVRHRFPYRYRVDLATAHTVGRQSSTMCPTAADLAFVRVFVRAGSKCVVIRPRCRNVRMPGFANWQQGFPLLMVTALSYAQNSVAGTAKPVYTGSIPVTPRALSSARLERLLDTQEVTGSSPVGPTTENPRDHLGVFVSLCIDQSVNNGRPGCHSGCQISAGGWRAERPVVGCSSRPGGRPRGWPEQLPGWWVGKPIGPIPTATRRHRAPCDPPTGFVLSRFRGPYEPEYGLLAGVVCLPRWMFSGDSCSSGGGSA